MSFKSFLLKYAAEMETIGTALDIVSRVSVENKSELRKFVTPGTLQKARRKISWKRSTTFRKSPRWKLDATKLLTF